MELEQMLQEHHSGADARCGNPVVGSFLWTAIREWSSGEQVRRLPSRFAAAENASRCAVFRIRAPADAKWRENDRLAVRQRTRRKRSAFSGSTVRLL